ncbi:DUF2577 domain-containing protein [Clostridium botulinum]|nr:DUF2577 domain-containing protein [Clostridium botulinum]NFR13693.1 DUF2577 domain-containing protein [Clostridium botulinum]NFR42240.1 DUF2577 domain-containing protein [Clostridium botulinum]NFS50680.1 DUF2577 domain-containing protein [Clostridium botulinum]
MTNLNELIKHIAINAIEQTKPVNLLYGEVKSINPLYICVNQKKTYTEEFLVLTRNVTDYDTYIKQENGEKKKYTIYNSLKAGDIVILLRVQGGQEFIVLDKKGEQ